MADKDLLDAICERWHAQQAMSGKKDSVHLTPEIQEGLNNREDSVDVQAQVSGRGVQDLVKATIDTGGGLWSRDKILLKMAEELGEVVQAFRKKTPEDQFGEVGDLGFALYCFALREGIALDEAIASACEKHIKSLAKGAS